MMRETSTKWAFMCDWNLMFYFAMSISSALDIVW